MLYCSTKQGAQKTVDIANEILRDTYKGNKSVCAKLLDRELSELRWAIVNAKRFVLDESMSEFLAALSTTPFKVAPERQHDILNSLRHTARLPFPKMFIQFDNTAFRRGLLSQGETKVDFWGDTLISQPLDAHEWPEWAMTPTDITQHIGYLIEQDANDNELIWVHEFTAMKDEGTMMPLPVTYAYRTDDSPLNPRHNLNLDYAPFAHGLSGADKDNRIGARLTKRFAVKASPGDMVTFQMPGGDLIKVHKIIPEFGGIIRYILCFLATLTNVPTINRQVRPSKGFIGGGMVRKYQDHTVLTLSLPRKMTTKTLAQRLIAKARRGWHEVIPHWRVNHPKPGQFFCATRDKHLWSETDSTGHATCNHCDALRVFIVLPKGRGDPTISVRTHSYKVTHAET